MRVISGSSAAALFASLSLGASAADERYRTFIEDVQALRRTELMRDLQINDLIIKYLPVGSPKDAVLVFCQSNGMNAHLVQHQPSESQKYNETINCSRTISGMHRFWPFIKKGHFVIGDDDVRVTFDLTAARLTRAAGLVTMQHL